MPEEIADVYDELPDRIDFNYNVKPILSDNCFHCHGPDPNTRQAGLRLDTEEGAFGALASGGSPLVAGKPSKSKVIERIMSHDLAFKMPPVASNLSLSDKDIATIYKWINQGAEWKPHWSFIPPVKSDVPNLASGKWNPVSEIDEFVFEKLESNGLTPSPPADKERLLRRVTIDLTGLPPALEEIDNFLNDTDPNAFEKVVDRLLTTDACAERLTMEWLDVARYADSHGMHADGYRLMWPWRDWVIKSFKNNMPYDEFVTLQLAGDLLPDATQEQILATAFNRNHPMTDEGGAIDEEFRVKYVADRTITAGTALLGLTMECASCHDHKFDPISQKEFYQMSAFFNNIKELGMTGADGNYGPMLLLTDSIEQQEIDKIKSYIADKEKSILNKKNSITVSNNENQNIPTINDIEGLEGYYPLESFKSLNGNGNWYALDGNADSRTRALPKQIQGVVGKGLEFTGEYDELRLHKIGLFEAYDPFSAGVWINTTKREEGKTQTIMGNTGQKNNFWRGWDFYLDDENKLNFRLVNSLPHNYLQVRSLDSISLNKWTHVMFTYDGSSKAKGVGLYINGKKADVNIELDKLYKSILPIKIASHVPDNRPVRVAKSYRLHTGEFGIFKGAMDEIRIYSKELTALEVALVSNQATKNEVKEKDEWLGEYIASKSPSIKNELTELKGIRKKLLELVDTIDEVMVMEEMPQPRPTFLLERGEYNQHGEQVFPGTPPAVLQYPDDLPKNRLGFAKWVFSKDNPLTARVTVNRYWQMIFGAGIVKTANDFGNQGELPTHPELLDWLAVDFVESGWDVKHLLKKMVMSATYRQSSKLSQELKEKDPANVFLARGPSYRWPAEIIRDNALASSGLLNREVGGESVKPYQPEGLWKELGNYSRKLLTYKEDSGSKLYRRSMYTFIRRTAPPPSMTIFDAPNRDVCTVSRERTNTPLQALVLLNDPQYVEAAKVLAERSILNAGDSLDDQISYAFRLATSRKPADREITILKELFDTEKNWFLKNRTERDDLLGVGNYSIDSKLSKTDLAAMTIVTSTILNQDETYMKR